MNETSLTDHLRADWRSQLTGRAEWRSPAIGPIAALSREQTMLMHVIAGIPWPTRRPNRRPRHRVIASEAVA